MSSCRVQPSRAWRAALACACACVLGSGTARAQSASLESDWMGAPATPGPVPDHAESGAKHKPVQRVAIISVWARCSGCFPRPVARGHRQSGARIRVRFGYSLCRKSASRACT